MRRIQIYLTVDLLKYSIKFFISLLSQEHFPLHLKEATVFLSGKVWILIQGKTQ